MSPSFVCLSGSYLEPREWLMTVSYRRYHAFRDYQGDRDLPVPSPPEIYADTHVNIVDFMVTRALTSRFSVSLEMPFEWASRTTYLEHDGDSLHTMRSRGFGDARIFGNVWVLDPVKNSHQNVSLKVGLKTPSGARAVKDNSFRETGPVLRPVDPAIQPATGGWGVVLGAQGFKSVLKSAFVYFDGTYLINPKEMNGTESAFADRPEITGGDIGYMVDSVPDQYQARVGISQGILPRYGLAGTIGLRTDGLPAHDWFGGSDGYRLPGYTISLEPGVTVSQGKNFFSVSVPITVKGHGSVSVADHRTSSPYAGIVTLADHQMVFSYSRRF